MKENANICLFKLLFDIEWDHQQVVVLYPYCFQILYFCVFDFKYLLGYELIDMQVFLPILEIVQSEISNVFEIVEKRS